MAGYTGAQLMDDDATSQPPQLSPNPLPPPPTIVLSRLTCQELRAASLEAEQVQLQA